ncbi:ABC transporter permease [Saccharopolyspora sp. K220]|uniref:ABC transporter permease n=1 Tax=Saccharopolyspora soli TaxID=2926618 RepID=UPI001F5642C6|nr:ABC transporter permease [Saccharopolyspora soli]MCI2423182.1 ABC transporter permease [Saccharopolyspora soli]
MSTVHSGQDEQSAGLATPGADATSVAPGAGDAYVAPTINRSWRGVWLRTISLASLVVVWFIAALFFDDSVLPGPVRVFGAMVENLGDSETYFHLWTTVYRVVVGMLIAVVLGLVIGLAMGLSKFGEQFLDSWILVAFTVPSVVYGILSILWFGLNDFAAIIAIGITAVPAVSINMWQGVKAIDLSLVRMGQAFHFSRASILRKLVVPQVIPYLLAALRYALGLSWKIATVVELIGLSSGVGFQLNYWYGLFNMTQVLAWTALFTIVLLLIEFLILKPTEHWLTRWRPTMQN